MKKHNSKGRRLLCLQLPRDLSALFLYSWIYFFEKLKYFYNKARRRKNGVLAGSKLLVNNKPSSLFFAVLWLSFVGLTKTFHDP